MIFHSHECLNCATPLDAAHAFCPSCGQKTATHRLSAHEIAHDLIHAFTHVDRGAFAVLKGLALRPGGISREFIEGKRKRYFNPFALLVVVVGVASLIMVSTNFMAPSFGPRNAVSEFFNKHVNLIILVQVPLLAMWSMLLFMRSKLRFVEHLVLAAYAAAFRSVFFVAVIMPVFLIAKPPYAALIATYLVIWLTYYGFAASQFYEGHRAWSFVRGLLVAVLAQVTMLVIIGGIQTAYIRSQSS